MGCRAGESVGKLSERHMKAVQMANTIHIMEQQRDQAAEEVQDAQASLASAKARHEEMAKKLIDTMKMPRENAKVLKELIDNAEESNRKFRETRARTALQKDHDSFSAQSKKLTEGIDKIDASKAKKMKAAKFPVPKLGFDSDGLIYQGRPFDQASHAEKLKVAVAMGLAMNPKLRVVLIRDGSLLDEESMAAVGKMADENDAQVWIERVGKGDKVSFIIEDGLLEK